MPATHLSIDYRTTAPGAAALFELFNTTGWNEGYHLSEHELARAVEHSWHVVAAYHEETLVGFGRIISDGLYTRSLSI